MTTLRRNLGTLGAILIASINVQAQTIATVGPAGYTNSFATRPQSTEWPTLSFAGTPADVYGLTNLVQGLTAANIRSRVADGGSSEPPNPTAFASWTSLGGAYLCTRPNGNRCNILMVRLFNNSGTNANRARITYDFAVRQPATEPEYPGQRAFYSLTGLPNTWVAIPEFSSAEPVSGTLSSELIFGSPWAQSNYLFVLWVDDNADTIAMEPAYTIDNFSVGVTAGRPVAAPLTVTLASPTNGAALFGPSMVPLVAEVTEDGSVVKVEFFLDGAKFGEDTATPYSLDWNNPPLGPHNWRAVVTDNVGTVVQSAVADFFVYDATGTPFAQITSPADGTEVEGPTNMLITAYAHAVDGVTNVQFVVNGTFVGEAAAEPYSIQWEAPFGASVLTAVAIDGNGRPGTSEVVHVVITIPPTNTTPPVIASQIPLAGGTITNLTSLQVTFSESVANVDAGDLQVNGVPATGVTGSGSNYTFTVTQPPYGPVAITWAANHGIIDRGFPFTLPFDAEAPGSTWTYDLVDRIPPVVTKALPAVGAIVSSLTKITVTFSKPVTGVNASDFLVDGAPAAAVSGSGASYAFTFAQPAEGTVTISWAAGHGIADTVSPPNAFPGTGWTYTLGTPLLTGNDNFANRIPLAGVPVSVRGSNVGATTEAGEPRGVLLYGLFQRGATVWWMWTAPVSGPVQIDTMGTSFDTTVGVYSGDAVNALTELAFNDNAPNGSYSVVTFNAVAETTYQIQVGGMPPFAFPVPPPATGVFQFNISMPPTVTLNSPTNGNVFLAGTPIELKATASSMVAPVAQVDFYRGGVFIGSDNVPPYSIVITNAPPGTNSFYAVVTDEVGQATTSTAASVLVAGLGVTITSPVDGTTYASTNPITVSTVTVLPGGTITNVEFFVDGVKFGEDAVPPFSAVWSNVASGPHRFTAMGLSDAGIPYKSFPANIAVAQLLMPSNSVWKYLDDGSDQGTAWYAASFDDSAWASGPAELGYGDGTDNPPRPEATVVNSGPTNNYFITTYFRRTFVATNISGFDSLLINIKRDDGAVVYFNGVETARFNMNPGVVTYTTLAQNAFDDGAGFVLAAVPASLLVEGTNVVAVEMHQSSPTSSDMSFDLELLAMPKVIRNQFPVVTVTNPTGGTYFLAPGAVTLEVSASDPDGSVTMVEFFVDGVKLGEAATAPFTWVWNGPPFGDHVVTAVATDDLGAKETSMPVTFAVHDAIGTPLAKITAPADGYVVEGPTNVAITATAHATNSVAQVLFFADGTLLGSDDASPYSMAWNDVPFGSHTLTAMAFDSVGMSGTSAPVTITITIPPTNTVPPMIVSQSPPAGSAISNLTAVQVTFSERVIGVDARDLLVNDVPATNMVGSGSNYVFSVAQPPYGSVRVRWAPDHGITDVGWPVHLVFYENEPSASWTYDLIDLTAPTLSTKTPAAGSTVTNLTAVSVTFSEAVSGVDASDLLVNGTPAYDVDGSGANYTFSVSQPASGTVNFTWATNHGIVDLAPAKNTFRATGPGATWSCTLDAKTILMQSNSMWFFVKGTNEASSPTDAWRQPGFDDSAWAYSAAPFFYGDPYSNGVPAYTHLDDMRSNYTCIYLRAPFVVPNATGITNLFLRAQIDDGMIVWINGVEVLRTNVAAGEIPYSGTAAGFTVMDQNGVAYVNYALLDPRLYLHSGTNVIAVHALNESLSSSSDFGFNAQIYTYQSDTEAVAPRVAHSDPAAGYVLGFTNITITFSEPVTNVDAGDLLINGVPAVSVSSSTNTTFTFAFPQPPYGAVAITWATGHGIVDLDIEPKPFSGTLPSSTWGYVLLNANSPYLTSVTPAAAATVNALSEIALTFSEPVTGVDAADLLINGSPAAGLNGSGANYTFTFPQPAYGVVAVTWAVNHGIQDLASPPVAFDPSWPSHTWSYTLVDQTPPTVGAVQPPAGLAVENLTQITVTFLESVAGVSAGDLLINGKPARSVAGSNSTYTFAFAQPNASAIAVTWAANHGIRDLATVPNAFDATAPGATWSYVTVDNMAPTAQSVTPPRFVTVRSLTQITVAFDEPVTDVRAEDLLANGVPAHQVSGAGAGPYTFGFSEPATGQVQVAWAAGQRIRDFAASPNLFGGGAWTYVLNPNLATEYAAPYLVHISLDGAGASYIEAYVRNAPSLFQNFVRLQNEGAWTLNARCDYDISVTLPNHASQFTGRPVQQPTGWANTTPHGLTIDQDNGQTIHTAGNPNVPYKMSSFDVAHDNGLSTAFLYSKQSLTLFARSWNASNGAGDTNGVDNGPNKFDFVFNSTTSGSYGPTAPVVDEFIKRVETNGLWQYTFMHFDDGDATGHASGWGSAAYSNAIMVADQQIGRVLNAIESNPVYAHQTVVIVTADHGGSGSGHFDASSLTTYRIPLFLWGAGISASVDLYSLFSNRADPGTSRPSYSDTSVQQPLRNGDVGNLAMTLLGLSVIPGSSIIPVFGEKPVPLSVVQSPAGITVSWPTSAANYEFQASACLGASANWQTITDGIFKNGQINQFHFVPAPETPVGFFRLRRQ